MGLRIARPVKDTQAGNNDILTFACSGMQGYREEMEDAHTTILKGDLSSLHDQGEYELAFFGVFDGHAGDFSAKFLSTRLLETVLQGERERKKNMADSSQYKILSDDDIIVQSFLKVDELIQNEGDKLQTKCAGSTAITTFILTNRKEKEVEVEIICCNVGDSRCVFGMDGKVIPLSEDQKPFHEKEEQRIVKAQCSVSFGRVNGQLAVARAFGDFEFKQNTEKDQRSQAVVCVPEIIRHKFVLGTAKVVPEDADYDNAPVLILACDGLWDVMSNEDSINYFRKNLRDVYFFDNQKSIPVEKFKSTRDLWTYKQFKDWSSDDCSSWIESLGPEYNILKRNNLFQNSAFLQYLAVNNKLPKIVTVTSLSDAVRRNRNAVDEFYTVDESDEYDTYASPDLETLYQKVHPKLQVEKARQDRYQEQLVAPPKSASEKLAFVCESMLDSAVFDKNSRDNVSVLLVVFSNLPYLNQA